MLGMPTSVFALGILHGSICLKHAAILRPQRSPPRPMSHGPTSKTSPEYNASLLSKPSPYHNEIFATNTLRDIDNSDLNLDDDVSTLETMLQEHRRQLDLARSKLRLRDSQETCQLEKGKAMNRTEPAFDLHSIPLALQASSSQRRVHGSSGT
ncbi:hypothetical protein NMY22_g8805 [Coprinellus aureogranulatus]|nr:hypothetical protein NMY22_g8805 [Coprinellus aureogranulatus]